MFASKTPKKKRMCDPSCVYKVPFLFFCLVIYQSQDLIQKIEGEKSIKNCKNLNKALCTQLYLRSLLQIRSNSGVRPGVMKGVYRNVLIIYYIVQSFPLVELFLVLLGDNFEKWDPMQNYACHNTHLSVPGCGHKA